MKKKVFFVSLIIILGGIFLPTVKTVFACVPACTQVNPFLPCTDPLCSDCGYCPIPSPGSSTSRIKNPILSEDLNQFSGTALLQKVITLVIELLFVGGAIIFFIMLLSGGIRWIASGGDKTRLEGARGQITHALIGLVILFSAFAIIKLIGTLFGIDLLKLSLPTL